MCVTQGGETVCVGTHDRCCITEMYFNISGPRGSIPVHQILNLLYRDSNHAHTQSAVIAMGAAVLTSAPVLAGRRHAPHQAHQTLCVLIQLAVGQPPHADLHPMRALFVIPRSLPPPALEGPFSAAFKAFVAACLQKEPTARPSAMELLRHPFLAAASELPPSFLSRISACAAMSEPPTFAEVRTALPASPNGASCPCAYALRVS